MKKLLIVFSLLLATSTIAFEAHGPTELDVTTEHEGIIKTQYLETISALQTFRGTGIPQLQAYTGKRDLKFETSNDDLDSYLNNLTSGSLNILTDFKLDDDIRYAQEIACDTVFTNDEISSILSEMDSVTTTKLSKVWDYHNRRAHPYKRLEYNTRLRNSTIR
jgi:hypothetical protein